MYCTISPISSMWPSSMMVGDPFGFTSAMLLPATSVVTRSAKVDASSRQTRDAGPSNPDGAGVSNRRFKNASEDGLSIETEVEVKKHPAKTRGSRAQGQEPRVKGRGSRVMTPQHSTGFTHVECRRIDGAPQTLTLDPAP